MDLSTIMDAVISFFNRLPPIAAAALTFVIGWALARLLRFLVSKILALLRFDRFSEKVGISGFLRKGNISYTPSALAGVLLYWFLMIIVLSNTVARLDQGAAASIALWANSALPALIVAVLIIVIGIVVVVFISNFFITIARNAAVRNPALIGKAIRYAGFIIVATMALEQLGLGRTIVSTIFIILFAALALGLALAFGLGCKDMAKKAMEDFLRGIREKERVKRGTDLEG